MTLALWDILSIEICFFSSALWPLSPPAELPSHREERDFIVHVSFPKSEV